MDTRKPALKRVVGFSEPIADRLPREDGSWLDAVLAPPVLITIYNQLGSRSTQRVQLSRCERNASCSEALCKEIRRCHLVSSALGFLVVGHIAIRRLHAMAALDSEIARGLVAREARRRRAAAEIVRRRATAATRRRASRSDRLIADTFCAVASFETYDALARAGYRREHIIAVMTQLARVIVARGFLRGASNALAGG